MSTTTPAIPDAPTPRKRARKIKTALGPFQTACSTFDRGERQIEIVAVTPFAIVYRLKGRSDAYQLPHAAGYQKAVAIAANAQADPRKGAVKRSVS